MAMTTHRGPASKPKMPATRKASPARQVEDRPKPGPAAGQKAGFPRIDLPVRPPYPPMEAKSVETIPEQGAFLFRTQVGRLSLPRLP